MVIIYIWLFILICFLIWHFLTLKYINPYTMDLYLSGKGGGKSSTIAKHILRDIKNHNIVYSNSDDIKINDVRIYDTFDLGKYKLDNACLYVDEVSLFFDNRNYKNTSREFISFLRGVRHHKLRCELYSQSYDCDRKIRTMCDNIYIGFKYFRVLTVWRRLRKNIAIKEDGLNAESQIVDELNFTPWFIPGSIKITFIPRYIKYFDSYKDLQSYMGFLSYRKVKDGFDVKKFKQVKKVKRRRY